VVPQEVECQTWAVLDSQVVQVLAQLQVAAVLTTWTEMEEEANLL